MFSCALYFHGSLHFPFILIYFSQSVTWKPQELRNRFGEGDYDQLGFSVALSANATTMVIGAPGNGSVAVYRTGEDGTNVAQICLTNKENLTYDWSEIHVDTTADGTTVICGSPGYKLLGFARVFKLVSDSDLDKFTWKRIGQDISSETEGDGFGSSVSISDDGKTIAVGALHNNDIWAEEDTGIVRIYHLDANGTSWKKIGDVYGSSVSLSGNGTVGAVGSPLSSTACLLCGLVELFQITENSVIWLNDLYGDNDFDYFGSSIDISGDGNTIAIGSSRSPYGYVRVYSNHSIDEWGCSNWKKIGKDITGDRIGDMFGSSISISDDGKTIAVGAYGANGNGIRSGSVRVFRIHDSDWMQLGEGINGTEAGDNSGWSLSLSGDGNTVAVGSPDHSSDTADYNGQVKVYVLE